MSLVVLAMDRSASGRLASSTEPSRASIRIALAARVQVGLGVGRLGRGERSQRQRHEGDQHGPERPGSHSLSLIFCPATSACGSSSGLSSCSVSTGTWVFSAIDPRLSPALTV